MATTEPYIDPDGVLRGLEDRNFTAQQASAIRVPCLKCGKIVDIDWAPLSKEFGTDLTTVPGGWACPAGDASGSCAN